jgi:1,4-alpha-glucan branching enzyme
MLYLDYSRKAGEWTPNVHGGRENLEAVEFLRRFNTLVYEAHPGAFTVAEESTAWPAVTRPVHDGGLGFGLKWNMGWMNDTLQYMGREPVHRRWNHHEMTFGLVYGFSENFVLPLSHDEVVHGKGSILGRMPGDEWRRFANLRAYYGFQWGYPGKKLLFMGQEWGQTTEWDFRVGLPWWLLDHAPHQGVQRLVRDLNRLHQEEGALHARDCEPEGFRWIVGDDADQSVFAWLRLGAPGDPPVAVMCNFTPEPRLGYRVGLPVGGVWREVLNTDSEVYGGSGMGNLGQVQAEPEPAHGFPFSAAVTLPPLSALYFRYSGEPGRDR